MGIAMIVMLIAVCGLVCGAGLVGFMLGKREVLPSFPPGDRFPTGQDERIELLEDELQRVKEQADFTERLLAERGDAPPGDPREADASD